MPYQPIENYGLIGNMRTAASVGLDGSIDWLCLPRFDSPSVFGAILDDAKGGRFLDPAGDPRGPAEAFYCRTRTCWSPGSTTTDGVAELDDFMRSPGPTGTSWSGRVRVVHGRLAVRRPVPAGVRLRPRRHDTHPRPNGARFAGPGLTLDLAVSVPLRRDGAAAVAEFTLNEGDCATFVLGIAGPGDGDAPRSCPDDAGGRAAVPRHGRLLAAVARPLHLPRPLAGGRLPVRPVLKLLTYEPTGAIVAAPTCSLPEHVGGGPQLGLRYCWLRDAAFTVYGLLRMGSPRRPPGSWSG
jgi:hypothetical protein